MNLNSFYNEVSRRADTGKTAISAAETKRVLSEAFLVLNSMSAADASSVIASGLATATKKTTKKAPKKKAAKKKAAPKKAAKRKTAKKK